MNTTTLGHIRKESTLQLLALNPLVWIIFLGLLFSYPIYRSVNRVLPKPLPKYYQVPKFDLINEYGKPFGTQELKGVVYIANFAFTNCPTTCPKLMEKTELIQKRLRGLRQAVRILTFSVDPINDKPPVLLKYAKKHHANPFVWHFLTGEREKLNNLLVNGFKVPMPTPVDDMVDIAHSEKLVLVDGNGYVRGYYGHDKNSINKLMIDIGILVNFESKVTM